MAAFLKEGEVGWMGGGEMFMRLTLVKGKVFWSPFLLLRSPLLKSLTFVTIRSFFFSISFQLGPLGRGGLDGRWGDVYEAASRKGERESSCLGDCGHISPISHPHPRFAQFILFIFYHLILWFMVSCFHPIGICYSRFLLLQLWQIHANTCKHPHWLAWTCGFYQTISTSNS